MDSYETLNETSGQDIKFKHGKPTNLINDTGSMGLTRDEQESAKPFQYYTTEFEDLNPDSLTSLTRGINFNNGTDVDPAFINVSSKLRNALVNQYPVDRSLTFPLPTTASFVRGHGNVDVENVLARPLTEKTKKSCDPLETHFYARTMNIFTEKTPSPYANIDDFFIPNDMQYGLNSRGNQTKKYDRSYSNKVESNCNGI